MVRDCSPDGQRTIATKLLNAFSEEENALPISENSAKSLDVTLLSGSNSYTVHVGDNEEKSSLHMKILDHCKWIETSAIGMF